MHWRCITSSPRHRLYKRKHNLPEVNALANFCFLTKDTNLNISDRLPEAYFPEIEAKHPGALASQWIPIDPELWKMENYSAFLDNRCELLAAEANRRLTELLHGELFWMERMAKTVLTAPVLPTFGGITSEAEEEVLEALNCWMEEKGLPQGNTAYDLANELTGAQQAVLDLAWPTGVQQGLERTGGRIAQ